MEKNIIAFILALLISTIVAPFVIKYTKQLKASQTILKYVKEHSGKQGTPTMGELYF